jgi:hypothetical protein
MPKWHSSETLRRSRSSWSALKVREKKNSFIFFVDSLFIFYLLQSFIQLKLN